MRTSTCCLLWHLGKERRDEEGLEQRGLLRHGVVAIRPARHLVLLALLLLLPLALLPLPLLCGSGAAERKRGKGAAAAAGARRERRPLDGPPTLVLRPLLLPTMAATQKVRTCRAAFLSMPPAGPGALRGSSSRFPPPSLSSSTTTTTTSLSSLSSSRRA